jgi:hypothetical protein
MSGAKDGSFVFTQRQTIKMFALRVLIRLSISNIRMRVAAIQSFKISVSRRESCGLSGGDDFLMLSSRWNILVDGNIMFTL